jgi:hypothetical protein
VARTPWRDQRDAAISLAQTFIVRRLRPVFAEEAEQSARAVRRLTSATVRAGAWGMLRGSIEAGARRLWERTTQVIGDGYWAQYALAHRQTVELAERFALPIEPLTDEQIRILARGHAAATRNGITLSQRVYRNRLANVRRVRLLVDEAVKGGWPVDKLATAVSGLIDPRTPGGVSYAAYRLAQTELTTAWFTRAVEEFQGTGWIELGHWRLSRRHPEPDVCDEVAAAGPYRISLVPARPHPLCQCWVEPDVDASLALAAAR